MLFSQLGGVWSIALLVIAFFAKNFVVNMIMNSAWAQTYVANKGWAALLNITSSLHAALSFAVLFFCVDYKEAVVLAIVIGVFEYLFGYWESRHRLPSITQVKMLSALNFISTLKSVGYTGILSSVIAYFVKLKIGN